MRRGALHLRDLEAGGLRRPGAAEPRVLPNVAQDDRARFGPGAARQALASGRVIVVYPEGTIVRGRSDIINLEAVYDSVGLTTNDFLRLFMEESLAIAHRAYRGSLVTLPVAVNGATGVARTLDGNGKITA